MKYLMCWELGTDLGHITLIRTVASGLIARGHSVVVAAKDTTHAYTQLDGFGISWVQAPFSHGISSNEKMVNHADILHSYGYHDPHVLAGLTKAWATLFNLVKPDRVVCESSPTAGMVARSLQIPVIALDMGFFVPPVGAVMPHFSNKEGIERSLLIKKEHKVLDVVNKAQALNKFPHIRHFSDIFNLQCLWLTWPEISHFGRHNEIHHIGPIYRGTSLNTPLDWKTNNEVKVFAYLKATSKYSLAILADLLSQGCEVMAYLPDFTSADIESLPNKNLLTVSHEIINFNAVMETTDFVVSHSGIGMMHSFLLNGKPQLMIPQQMEQYLLSKAVVKSGLGQMIDFKQGQLVKTDIEKLVEMKAYVNRFSLSRRSSMDNFQMLLDNLIVF
jgi:UDP:flavonoid glycosyltransferase YjiC (YdhE family)